MSWSMWLLLSATWTLLGEQSNCRFRRLRTLRRRISRRSGSSSAAWASSSSRAKPFSIFSIVLPPFKTECLYAVKGYTRGQTIPQMSDFCLAYLSYTRHHREPLAHRTEATHNAGCELRRIPIPGDWRIERAPGPEWRRGPGRVEWGDHLR